jgi:adenosylcobinamide-phosphate guanylyltransferase|nr:MAG: cobalamin biosynthesis protein CobY [Vulcanisaeta sp. AZ3]
MIIVIMAGGKGSRIGNPNKPLIKLLNKPMIEHVIEAVNGLGTIHIATTARHNEIIKWSKERGYEVILTSGNGYPNDILEALKTTNTPTLILPSDLPLLSKNLILKFLRLTAYIRTPMITLIAERNHNYEYTGISYVRSITMINGIIPWASIIIPWTTELININTKEDLNQVLNILKH